MIGIADGGYSGQDATMLNGDSTAFGARVGAYLMELRSVKGWSREHTAALIRAETGGGPVTNTYRRWELTGDVSIVDLEAAVAVLGGSLEQLVDATATGEPPGGAQPEPPRSDDDPDGVADPRARGASGGLGQRRSSKRGARQARRDPT
jgi:hypothetical protein